MSAATCPECGTPVPFHTAPKMGERVTCPQCGAELQVSGLEPLEVDYFLRDPEDEVKLDFTDEEDYDKG